MSLLGRSMNTTYQASYTGIDSSCKHNIEYETRYKERDQTSFQIEVAEIYILKNLTHEILSPFYFFASLDGGHLKKKKRKKKEVTV